MNEKEKVKLLMTMTATLTGLIGWLKGKGLWEEVSKTLQIDEQWKDIGKG
jgi:hypothetical protein